MAAGISGWEYRTLPSMTSFPEYQKSQESPESRAIIGQYIKSLRDWKFNGDNFNQIFNGFFGNRDELLTRLDESAVVRLSASRRFPRLSPQAIEDEVLRPLEHGVVGCRQAIGLISKMCEVFEERYFGRGTCLDELIGKSTKQMNDLIRFIALRRISAPENDRKVLIQCREAYLKFRAGILEINKFFPEKELEFSKVDKALELFCTSFFYETEGSGNPLNELIDSFQEYKNSFREFDHSKGVEYFKFLDREVEPLRETSPAEEGLRSEVLCFSEQPPQSQIPLADRLGS